MKRRVLLLVILLVGSTVGLAMAQLTTANFNAATGFSGRHGFTCTSCHNVPNMGPAGEDEIYGPPAAVSVAGIPDQWQPGQAYRLTVSVTGGPPALPNPAPQGGFEIEADDGTFEAPADMQELVEVYAPGAVTYTVAGTQVREWAVTWLAPEVTSEPQPVQFWVAGMAANGNHVIAAGLADGGELGDSVDNDTFSVPPSQEAFEAWDLVRLEPPRLEGNVVARPFEPFTVRGVHTDSDATHVGYRIDDNPWGSIEARGPWALQINGLSPGTHDIWVRSEAPPRASEPVHVSMVLEEVEQERATPTGWMAPVLLVVFALARRYP